MLFNRKPKQTSLEPLKPLKDKVMMKKMTRAFIADKMDEAFFVAEALKQDGRQDVTIWRRGGGEDPMTYSVTWNETYFVQAAAI